MHPIVIPIDVNPFAPRVSGTVQYVMQLARRLLLRGHEVTLWGAGGPGEVDGIQVTRITDQPTRELLFAMAIRREARSLDPTKRPVAIANGEHYAAAFSRAKSRCKTVLVAHGPIALSLRRKRPIAAWFFEKFIERKAVATSASIIAIDSEAEVYFGRKYPDKEIERLPVGVDLERFSPGDRGAARVALGLPSTGELVLVAARPAPEKNLELAGDALSKLSEVRPDVRLAYAGGKETDPIVQRLKSHMPHGKFHLLGELGHDQMIDAFRASNVLLVSSREEQFPTVVLESMACGIPVVATPVGDVPKILQGNLAGRCVPPTARNLAQALDSVLDSTENLAKEVSAVCRATAEPFSWERIGKEVSRICEAAWRDGESDITGRRIGA